MKKTGLMIVALLFSAYLFSQQLNQAGHLINIKEDSPSLNYRVSYSADGSIVEVEGMKLKGNSVFRISDGFITLSGNYENIHSTLRIYTNEGEEIFAETFPQTINFSLSPSRNFCAFHDGTSIRVISLKDKKVQSFQGSNVFSVNDTGQLAYYNEKKSTINFEEVSVQIDEPVYRILFFRDQTLFITKKNVLLLRDNTVETVFTSTEGRIFDTEIFSNKIFISVKSEMVGEFIFNSFSSNDLQVFTAEEEIHYQLVSQLEKSKIKNINSKPDSLDNELIRNPLNYYQDTVYQPVGNSYDEIQEYSIGSPYLHPGVDLMGVYLQDVYSVKSGYTKAILTISAELHWRIAVANENTSGYSQGYLYAHLEETSIPYAVGDFVNEGDVVGQLVYFSDDFVHCHFARIGGEGAMWDGDWWTFDNPLSYMTNFFDTIPPQFEKTIGIDAFAFRDVNGNYLSPDNLFGSIQIISKVHDRVNADWKVEVNKLRYSVSPLSSPGLMLIDTVAYEYDFYNDHYFGGPYYTTVLNTIYSRDNICYSTADYQVREYYHIVTNSDGNDTIDLNDSEQLFNTLNFPDGSYIFRVTAFDPSENTTVDSMVIEIKNGVLGTDDHTINSQIKIWPNPFTSKVFLAIQTQGSDDVTLIIRNTLGQEVLSIPEVDLTKSNTTTIDLGFFSKGIYFLDTIIDGERMISKVVKD